MFEWLKRKLEAHKREKYELSLMKKYGCVLYCYKCREILDQPVVEEDSKEGLYSYRCAHCGACCTFDFASFPVPVKVEECLLSEWVRP